MTWITLALIASLAKAFANLSEKQILTKEEASVYVSVFSFVIAFLSLPLLFFVEDPHLSIETGLIIFFISTLSVASALTAAYVIQKLDVSESAGLFALSPLFVTIFATIFLRETVAVVQIAGIIISILGVYILEHRFNHHLVLGIHGQEKLVLTNHSVKKTLTYVIFIISLILFSICTVADRYIIRERGVDPLLFLVVIQFFIVFNFLAYDMVARKNIKSMIIDPKLFLRLSFWTNIVSIAIHRISHMLAVSLVEISILNAFKQISAVFTTLLAGTFFKEKHQIRRILGCICIVIGVAIVVFGAK